MNLHTKRLWRERVPLCRPVMSPLGSALWMERVVCRRVRAPCWRALGAKLAPPNCSNTRRFLATQKFPLPHLGDSIAQGTLVQLHKQVGQHTQAEEVFATMETDKVTVQLRAPAAGIITNIFPKINEDVLVGNDLVEIDTDAQPNPQNTATAQPSSQSSPEAASTQSSPHRQGSSNGEASLVSVRIHPSGNPSRINFHRGRRETEQLSQQTSAAPSQQALGPSPSPSPPPQVPQSVQPKSNPITVPTRRELVRSQHELPVRFGRLSLSDEEMECIDSGGADFKWQ